MVKPLFDLEQYGDRVAVVQDDRRLTYHDLSCMAQRIAAPAKPRALAFMLCTNSVASLAAYVGFLRRGVVPLLIEATIERGLLTDLIDRYHPSYLWLPTDQATAFDGAQALLECESYQLLSLAQDVPVALHDDLALLISTSGSTGSPKLVRQTKENLTSNARSIIEYLSITANDVAITSLPMSYVYGLSIINTHLLCGARIVLTSLASYSGGFWELVRREGVTSFSGVPFMYEMLDRLHFTTKFGAGSLQTMTQAGGRLDPVLQDRFASWAKQQGIRFVIMYGASEATARMAYLPLEYAQAKRGSIGIAIPGGRFEVVDDSGTAITSPHVPGNLVYYGSNVTMGYATSFEDLAKGDERHGRLETGDVAEFDEDGFYYIVGRRSRFVKIMGKRVGLDEVEHLVSQRFGLFEVACVGDDSRIVVCTSAEADAAQIRDYVHASIGVNARMVEVRTGLEIPKTASGKRSYDKLRRLVDTEATR